MRKTTSGFTIVELLIVIVVIAILASITIVAYNGLQQRTRNTARHSEVVAWNKQFEIYKALYGQYPSMPDGGYCLGTNFPVGYGDVPRCRDYAQFNNSYIVSDSTSLMNELKNANDDLPDNIYTPVGETVGPYVEYDSTYIQIIAALEGDETEDCPSNMEGTWSNGSTLVICRFLLTR